ncbi:MAG: hypothetical protein QXI16_05405 [Sulfolobaceae archaeon]
MTTQDAIEVVTGIITQIAPFAIVWNLTIVVFRTIVREMTGGRLHDRL